MTRPSLRASSLHNVGVILKGAWLDGPRRRWEGIVSADEPIVTLAIQESYGAWSWCKSSARKGPTQEVSLLLGEHDRAGTDVHVNFECGRGQVVSRCGVDSKAYKPAMPDTLDLKTGELATIAMITGEPVVALMLLVLAGRDVKVGRNHLWHLRRELADDVDEPFRKGIELWESW